MACTGRPLQALVSDPRIGEHLELGGFAPTGDFAIKIPRMTLSERSPKLGEIVQFEGGTVLDREAAYPMIAIMGNHNALSDDNANRGDCAPLYSEVSLLTDWLSVRMFESGQGSWSAVTILNAVRSSSWIWCSKHCSQLTQSSRAIARTWCRGRRCSNTVAGRAFSKAAPRIDRYNGSPLLPFEAM